MVVSCCQCWNMNLCSLQEQPGSQDGPFVPVCGETLQSQCVSPEFEGHGLPEHKPCSVTLQRDWVLCREIGDAVC